MSLILKLRIGCNKSQGYIVSEYMAHYATDEPIYALATPYSPSALAVIRASGEGVLSLLSSRFSLRLEGRASGSAVHGFLKDGNGGLIDEVMVIRYDHGHGYTGEEAFEIMCHGSLPVIRMISKMLEELGIREAERGEFTTGHSCMAAWT